MQQIRRKLSALRADTRAVTALEYGMIAALIAVVAIAGFTTIGTSLSSTLSVVGNVPVSAQAPDRDNIPVRVLIPGH